MIDPEYKAIRTLRDAGYAVAVFSPEELDGVSIQSVENAMVSNGSDAIEELKLKREMEGESE